MEQHRKQRLDPEQAGLAFPDIVDFLLLAGVRRVIRRDAVHVVGLDPAPECFHIPLAADRRIHPGPGTLLSHVIVGQEQVLRAGLDGNPCSQPLSHGLHCSQALA